MNEKPPSTNGPGSTGVFKRVIRAIKGEPWSREDFQDLLQQAESVFEPDEQERRINVDTGACFGGPLTCVVLAPEERPRCDALVTRARNIGLGVTGADCGIVLFADADAQVIAAAHAGYDVVMCPAAHTYFDLAHSSDPEDWGATWAGILPLDKTLLWDPVPAESQDIAARILGVQGCFWGEFTTQDAQAEAMIAPRIFGLACKAWEMSFLCIVFPSSCRSAYLSYDGLSP